MSDATVRRISEFPYELTYEGTTDIWTLDSPELEAGVSYVKVRSGATLHPHYHEEPTVVIYVTKGSGYVILGDDEHQISEGDVISIPTRAVHGFRTADMDLEFLSVQTPRIYLDGTEEKDTHFVR